jgi:hypothetical protein
MKAVLQLLVLIGLAAVGCQQQEDVGEPPETPAATSPDATSPPAETDESTAPAAATGEEDAAGPDDATSPEEATSPGDAAPDDEQGASADREPNPQP